MLVRGRITRTSKTKVVVARSTGVHIGVIMRRIYLGEYRIVIVHLRVHGIIKVNRFVICRVISHCTTRRLDMKRRRGGREGEKARVIGTRVRVMGLMRWIRGYIAMTKERIILRIRRSGKVIGGIMVIIRMRVGVVYTMK